MQAFLRANKWSCVHTHSRLSVFWTAATVRPLYWQNRGSYSPGLSATNRFLVPANAMSVRQQGVPQFSILTEGITGHTRLLLQPSSAAVSAAVIPTREYSLTRHRTDRDNCTKETDGKIHPRHTVKSAVLQGFLDFAIYVISKETSWKPTNLSRGILRPF